MTDFAASLSYGDAGSPTPAAAKPDADKPGNRVLLTHTCHVCQRFIGEHTQEAWTRCVAEITHALQWRDRHRGDPAPMTAGDGRR
jgi:hypothetical protein